MIQFVSSLPRHGQAYLCVFSGAARFMKFTANVQLERNRMVAWMKTSPSLTIPYKPDALRFTPTIIILHIVSVIPALFISASGAVKKIVQAELMFAATPFYFRWHAHKNTRTLASTHTHVHQWYLMHWCEGNNLLCGTGQVSACPHCWP